MPASLSEEERSLLSWVLPSDRRGYREAAERIATWEIIARGRRGEGHWIIGEPGLTPDHEAPLAGILATGVVVTERGELMVTVREPGERSVDIEFSGATGGAEKRRWTLSTWRPGMPCPDCDGHVRESAASTASRHAVVLSMCTRDRRIWVFDGVRDVNLPIPVTLFYSELMRQTQIKDPEVALAPGRLFESLASYTDHDLLAAFARYNAIRSKVPVDDPIAVPRQERRWFERIRSFFVRGSKDR